MKGSQVSFLFLQRRLSENHSVMKNPRPGIPRLIKLTFFTALNHLPTLFSTQTCFVLGSTLGNKLSKAQGDVDCAGPLLKC